VFQALKYSQIPAVAIRLTTETGSRNFQPNDISWS
jgi:hypothetical protein